MSDQDECAKDNWQVGKPAPRYCNRCGLGPCSKHTEIIDRPLTTDDTFPYLKVAREQGVPYPEVIQFVQRMADIPPGTAWGEALMGWQWIALNALGQERHRRMYGPWL